MSLPLRELLWTLILGILSLLLNLIIPACSMISVGLNRKFSCIQLILSTCISVAIYQFCLWASGELLPLLVLGRHASLADYVIGLPFDVQQSVAHLTVIGCALAAIISGFATVSFPLQQLMILRGVETGWLHDRRTALVNHYDSICELKKLDYLRKNRSSSNPPMLRPPSCGDGGLFWLTELISDCILHAQRWLGYHSKRKTSFDGGNDPGVLRDTSLASTYLASPSVLIHSRELAAENLFLELVQLNELIDESVNSRSLWGRFLQLTGYIFSAVGFFRVYVGSIHTVAHVMGHRSHTTYSENEIEDMVTTVIRLMSSRWNLKVDQLLWPPALTFLMVGVLSLMQVRVFLTSVQDFAGLGLLSRNTELYSLLLSHFAGVYFVACVVLLRIQLPPRRRLAVTVALGKDIHFDFYLLWFDFFFVVSAIFFGVLIFLRHIRRQRYGILFHLLECNMFTFEGF